MYPTMRGSRPGFERIRCVGKSKQETAMDSTTLIVLVIVLLVVGGGFYGRGRWF